MTLRRQYLELALAEESGYSDAVGVRNSLRMYLTALFPARECVALSRAVEGSAVPESATDLPPRDALRTQFVDAVDKLYGSYLTERSSTQLPVKELMGRELDTSQLALVTEAYVAALNAGQLPAIQTASNLLLEQAVSVAFDDATRAYRAAFQGDEGAECVAVTSRDLRSNHWRGVQAANAKLLVSRTTIFSDDKAQTSARAKEFDERAEKWQQQVESEIRERIEAAIALAHANYAKAIEEVLPRSLDEQMADRLADTYVCRCIVATQCVSEVLTDKGSRCFACRPRESFSDGLLESLTHYKTDLMTALASYKSQGDGPQLYSALENALLQDVSPSVQRFGAQVLAQLSRHISSWREENQQLERDLEAARARDEQATVSAAEQKRQYEDQLAQSTQELSKMRSELQGELNTNKSELERLTSDLTTMNLKHEIRVKNAESDLEWARRRTEEMEASIRDRQQRQLELQLQMEQGADELLTTERGFHQEERALLSQQKELMSKVVQLQRELVQKKTTHVQQVFTVENEHAKQVDDIRAAHAEFVRKLRAQAKSDLAMLRLVHQRKKSAAQTQLAELDEQVADLRARMTTCDVNDDAAKNASAASSSSTTGRDLFRALSMTLTAAITDASKTDAKVTRPAPEKVSEPKDETANGASTSAADAPKPRDTSMCAQS